MFIGKVVRYLSISLICACAGNLREASSVSLTSSAIELQNLTPIKVSIRPGEVAHFEFNTPNSAPGELFCGDGVKVPTMTFTTKRHVFLSESYFSTHKPYNCHWKTESGDEIQVAEVEVLPKTFPSERLNVDRRRVVLSPEDRRRVTRENRFKARVYAGSPAYPLFDEAFELPILSQVTSIYGARRIFNNRQRTQHLGTDYRAAVGTSIRASNSGKVVLSRSLFYTGETVIIDHGVGIFTLYGHLSELKVEEGDTIAKGHILGLSGQSGRVTGPHLHWGVTVGGFAIEGDSLIAASGEFL